MNKYKIVSALLAVALLASLARLFMSPKKADARSAVLDNILSRKSVRAYTDEKVSREQLDTLVRMGMAAPSSRDMRPWQFYIVDDKAVLERLGKTNPRAKALYGAPAAIVVCGDTSVVDTEGRPSRAWMNDCSAATQNILLAAEAMGLGAVWTAAWPYDDRIRGAVEALKLPEGIIPMAVICVGHPKGDTQPKDKYNKDAIHFNDVF